MPPVRPIYTVFFNRVEPFAKQKQQTSFEGFVRELEQWKQHWDQQPRPGPHAQAVKGTLKAAVASTFQQEADELLIFAVQTSDAKSELLLAAGASPNARGFHSKKHALTWVVEKRSPALLQLFIDKGVDVADVSKLMTCAAGRSLAMVQVLVAAGVVVDGERSKYTGLSPLGAAVSAQKQDVARFLLDNGANVNGRCPYTLRTALHFVPCTHANCTRAVTPQQCVTLPLDEPAIRVFRSCNPAMFALLESYGADMTVLCHGQIVCRRGVQEHNERITNERRLAFAFMLHDRVGNGGALGHQEELVRMVLDLI
jgi:Ankyrin repeats (3 copies)